MKKKPIFLASAVVALVGSFLFWRGQNAGTIDATNVGPNTVEQQEESKTRAVTMGEVLELAQDARDHSATNLNDYTATFVKQEVEANGKLGPESSIEMRVQTRLRNETDDAPMRVYLHFTGPESVNGREIIWGEDLYDGQMAVHEVGMMMGWKTWWLDPNGIVAMQGQRYPISEIGLVKLVEKLIERGEKDRNNPDVTATLTKDHSIDGVEAQLIQVRRAKPSGDEDEDFSMAEISIDPKRKLILQYRSFGWPAEEGDEELPLQESYTYRDIKTNIGLKDIDFDVTNPAYKFPK